MTNTQWITKIKIIAEEAVGVNVTKAQATEIWDKIKETEKEILLSGDKLVIVPGATVTMINKAAKMGINPQTKEPLQIPARKAFKIKMNAEGQKTFNNK